MKMSTGSYTNGERRANGAPRSNGEHQANGDCRSHGELKILDVFLAVRETSAPYNEHRLPWAEKRDITLCTFFPSDVSPPQSIDVFEGDGTIRGFLRALKRALAAKEYDIIHAHSPHVGLLFLVGTVFRKRLASSAVITVHDSYPNFKPRNRLMFVPVFARFRSVVCCGRASFESFPRAYKGLAGHRLGFVQNGLNIARIDRIARASQNERPAGSDFTIAAISRLVEIKNPATVLTAFQAAADATSRLVYMGDGPLRSDLLSQRRAADGAERIEFTGLVPREHVFERLLRADVFVSASRGEGLPVAVLEAMACRRPVILSDIPPHREIAEGVDFIPLIDPDDVAGFAREMRKFQELPAAQRVAIGRRCRQLVDERFSLPAMHAGYSRIYSEIANRDVPSLQEVG
jgi:glycosyltransferase involved in cell wall biosynthesis